MNGGGSHVSFHMYQVIIRTCTCRCVIHSCCFVLADGEQELKLHILDIEVPYYNEYLGCQQLPVFSPKTDAYFISLTQVQLKIRYRYNTFTVHVNNYKCILDC